MQEVYICALTRLVLGPGLRDGGVLKMRAPFTRRTPKNDIGSCRDGDDVVSMMLLKLVLLLRKAACECRASQ